MPLHFDWHAWLLLQCIIAVSHPFDWMILDLLSLKDPWKPIVAWKAKNFSLELCNLKHLWGCITTWQLLIHATLILENYVKDVSPIHDWTYAKTVIGCAFRPWSSRIGLRRKEPTLGSSGQWHSWFGRGSWTVIMLAQSFSTTKLESIAQWTCSPFGILITHHHQRKLEEPWRESCWAWHKQASWFPLTHPFDPSWG